MRRKGLLMLGSVCLILVLVAITACAAPSPSPTPSPTPSPSPSPTPSPTPSPSPSPAPPGQLPEVHWRWQSAYPAGDQWATVFTQDIIDIIADKSGGKFTGERFFASEIIPPDEMLTGIGAGLAEAGEGAPAYWVGIEPALDLTYGLPMTNRGPVGDFTAFQNLGPWSEETRKIFQDNGCHYIGSHTYGPYPVLMSRVPIHGIDDWKGVKVRVSGYHAALLDEMGASTTYIPGAEVGEALSMGTIDVATWSAEAVLEMGWGELIDYLIMPTFMDHQGGVTFVNQEAWDSLPDEYQEYILEAERQVNWDSHRFYAKYMADDINLATGAGTPGPYGYDVIWFSEEDVAEMERLAKEVVWQGWAQKSPLCAKGIEIVEEWYGPIFRM